MSVSKKFIIMAVLFLALWGCGVDDVSTDAEPCDDVPQCPAGTVEVAACGVSAQNCQVRERCGFRIYCQLGQQPAEEPDDEVPGNSLEQPNDEPGDEPGEDNFDENNHAQIELSSDAMIFAQVAPGRENSQVLKISNQGVGDGILLIRSVAITGDEVFFPGEAWPNTSANGAQQNIALAVGEALELSIVYRPTDASEVSGSLVIQSDDPFRPLISVPLSRSPHAPKITATPVVRFSNVPAGSYDWQFVEVHNEGDAPLQIDAIVVDGSESFSLSFPVHFDELDTNTPIPAIEDDNEIWPDSIEPGDFFRIRVKFSPADSSPQVGDILIYTNAPSVEDAHIVGLSGNRIMPCINVTHYETGISFGQSTVGHISSRYIGIENCSLTRNLQIHSIEISDDDSNVFALDESSLPGNLSGETAYIAPNDTVYVGVTFTPSDVGLFSGTITIRTNSESHSEMRIAIEGTGTLNECPVAMASAASLHSGDFGTNIAVPFNTTVEFSSDGSYDPDGEIERIEWSVLTSPPGELVSFGSNSESPSPRLSLSVLGIYEIELILYDDDGLANCAPAIVRIEVVTDHDIYIELSWHTPSVQNPRPGNGTDLDLHYLHPTGSWNNAPWDVYYQNREQNWGTEENPSIAKLYLDDSYGVRPEVVTHDNPVNGLNYRVGVHYYSTNGYGATHATLRIFTYGELLYEARDKRLSRSNAFWDAVGISWPSREIVIIDNIQDVAWGYGW